MGEAGQFDRLGVGQPLQQQLLPLREQHGAGRPADGERRLLDAVRIGFDELPLLDGLRLGLR